MNIQESQIALPPQQQKEIIQQEIVIPKPQFNLIQIFSELRSLAKERLDTQQNQEQTQSIKGLKFISGKLAKLFSKNRKLPYNEISKILIDNFASEQKDQRNIKRRVYDAINVLVAAEVFQKKGNFIEMQKNKIRFKKQGQNKEEMMNKISHLKEILFFKKQKLNKIKKEQLNIQRLIERNKKTKLLLKNKLEEDKIQGVQMVLLAQDQSDVFPSKNMKIQWETIQNSLVKKSSRNSKSSSMKTSKQKNNKSLQISILDKSKVKINSFLQILDCIIEQK